MYLVCWQAFHTTSYPPCSVVLFCQHMCQIALMWLRWWVLLTLLLLLYIHIDRTKMTSSVSSARSLFVESKERLCDRIQVNVTSVGSLARQIVKGSKSSETLMHTARNFALQEHALHNSEVNLCKMQNLVTTLQLQADAIQKCAQQIEVVKEQLHRMQWQSK